MPRLTKRLVDAAVPKAAPYFVWCSELAGFGVRVFSTGKAVFYADYRNAAGARKRMAIGAHGKVTCEEARKLALSILGSVVKGEDPAQERQTGRKAMTVAQLCDQYVLAAEGGHIAGKGRRPKKASTLYTDRGRIERHIKPLLGGKRVIDLSAADIGRFIRDVSDGKTATIEKTANKRGKAVVEGGRGTATRTAGLLGGILSFAVQGGIIATNPARGVQRPAGERRKRRLGDEDYRALGKALAAADAHHEPWQLIAVVRLLALTGARLSEIVKLRWMEVDLTARCLRLSDSKEGELVRPLGGPAIKLLAALERSNDGFVFPAVRRGQGAFGGMAGGWRRLMQRAELQGVTMHTLRHSFASKADDLGLSTATVGAMLGHASGNVTSRYIHKMDAVLIAAADTVATAIEAELTAGGEDGAEQRRLLQAFSAEPGESTGGTTAGRDGRPTETDDRMLWDMALRIAEKPGLSQREAARLAVKAGADKTHSAKAAADRLRRKYRESADLLESFAAWVKTRQAS